LRRGGRSGAEIFAITSPVIARGEAVPTSSRARNARASHRLVEDVMQEKWIVARVSKLAALLALFGLALILDNCADQAKGDETQRPPQGYSFGGPAW